MELSVVIPARNEAPNVAPLVAEIRAALDGHADYEIVYVDDGSSDDTAAAVRAAMAGGRVRLLQHAKSCGQSAAVRSGVIAARSAWIATLDADGQNDPVDIRKLWERARAMIDRDGFDDPAFAQHQCRQEAVIVIEERQSEIEVAPQQLQPAAGIGGAVLQHAAADRVGDARGYALHGGVAALLAKAGEQELAGIGRRPCPFP